MPRETTTQHEIHEIAQYTSTIDGVEKVDHPIEEDKLTEEAREEIDTKRVIGIITTDPETFHDRMRARFDCEEAASINVGDETSFNGVTHITIHVEETRQERGYDPVVEFVSLNGENFEHIDRELRDNGMGGLTDDLKGDLKEFEYIKPMMPDDC